MPYLNTVLRLLALGTVFIFSFVGPGRAAPPAEAFGSLPQIGGAALSPDGKHLALIAPVNGSPAALIYDLSVPGSPAHAVTIEDALAGYVFWPNNERLIVMFRGTITNRWVSGVQAGTRAVTTDVNGGDAQVLMSDQFFLRYNYSGTAIMGLDADDPHSIFMAAWETNSEMNGDAPQLHDIYALNLFLVNVETGGSSLVYHGTPHTVRFLMDGHGHLLGRVEQDADLRNHIFSGNEEITSYSVKGGEKMSIEGVTKGSDPAYAVRALGKSGTWGLYTYAGKAGLGSALFEDPRYDVDDAIEDERDGSIIGATYIDDTMRVRYLDPARQAVQRKLEQAFLDQSVRIVSSDVAGSVYVVAAEGPRHPPTYYLFKPATMVMQTIGTSYPALSAADLGEVKPYPYKARDGLDIHAYLTLPPGRDPHNLPTVIFPHGGPETRDFLHFDWWAQFLASRGYAVLQPNFRGSSGYGAAFVQAGDGEWARKVQYDVQDGVTKLIADGIADPKRICIVGASYGGYMALAGATFSPDLYACAVSYAGVSDLARLLYTGTTFESEAVSIWERRMGAARSDSAKLDAQSPAEHAAQVKIPVLLIHSDNDATVPIKQSETENEALKDAGKKVQFVTLAGDDHYLSYAKTRIQLLEEIEKFLAANIGPNTAH